MPRRSIPRSRRSIRSGAWLARDPNLRFRPPRSSPRRRRNGSRRGLAKQREVAQLVREYAAESEQGRRPDPRCDRAAGSARLTVRVPTTSAVAPPVQPEAGSVRTRANTIRCAGAARVRAPAGTTLPPLAEVRFLAAAAPGSLTRRRAHGGHADTPPTAVRHMLRPSRYAGRRQCSPLSDLDLVEPRPRAKGAAVGQPGARARSRDRRRGFAEQKEIASPDCRPREPSEAASPPASSIPAAPPRRSPSRPRRSCALAEPELKKPAARRAATPPSAQPTRTPSVDPPSPTPPIPQRSAAPWAPRPPPRAARARSEEAARLRDGPTRLRRDRSPTTDADPYR